MHLLARPETPVDRSNVASMTESPSDPTGVASLIDHLSQIVRGKRDAIRTVVVCLLARGHVLLEDKPGLGKTTLAKHLASAIGGAMARVQCTPDLMPSDVTGFNLLNPQTRQFEFRPGPVFADVLLADEINRTTPRTQSALLEAMAERQVSIDGQTYPLKPQFFVIATQNPIEQHGAFPLPEAQLDRFMVKLSLGYPDRVSELMMLQAAAGRVAQDPPPSAPMWDESTLVNLQARVAQVHVADSIQQYLVTLATASREDPKIHLGLSPRGLLAWQRAAQASAMVDGRDYVIPEDVQDLAWPILGVRLGVDDDVKSVVDSLLERTPAPAI
jgi:MoxR-like ATPase